MTVTVPAAPSGPPTPTGGWTVAFADGFGTTLFDRTGTTRASAGTSDAEWVLNGGAAGEVVGFNADEIQNFSASQVSLQTDGLHLTAAYTPNRALPGNGGNTANYLSGFVQSCREALSDGFKWTPGGGITWAFEILTKFAPGFDGGPTSGGNDEGWWSSGRSGIGDEFDFFEHWGWRGPPSVTADVWVYDPSGPSTVSISGNVTQFLGADPAAGFHRYTTLLKADNSFAFYIDGRLFGSRAAPPNFLALPMKLILSYALRNPSGSNPRIIPGFSTAGQTRDWVIRSVAVYQDAPNAGRNIIFGGVAPGTVIAGSTTTTVPAVPAVPTLSLASSTTVRVAWGSVADATSYTVFRRLSGATAWTQIASQAASPLVDTVSPGVTYQYSVSASNAAGSSAQSAAATIAVPAVSISPPGRPSASVSAGVVSLSWGEVTGATSYGVYRRLAGASVWGGAIKSSVSTSATDTPAAGATYEYAVTARTATSESAVSLAASAVIPSDPTSVPEEGPDVEIISQAFADEGPDVEIVSLHIVAPVAMTALAGVSVTPVVAGLNFLWTAPPSNQNVSEVHIYVWRLGTVKPTVPQFVGLGSVSGSKMFGPVGGLTGGQGYQWEIRPAREE
jgi:hypothetical protein